MSVAMNKYPPELDDVGFCLGQAFQWISRCYQLGQGQLRADDPDASKRMHSALANGIATISARLDLNGHTAEFFLHLDHGPATENEILLFSQGFIPAEPLN